MRPDGVIAWRRTCPTGEVMLVSDDVAVLDRFSPVTVPRGAHVSLLEDVIVLTADAGDAVVAA